MSKNALHRLYDHLTRGKVRLDVGRPGLCGILHIHPAPQHVDSRTGVRRPIEAILGPMGPGLCKTLHPDFREHPI